MTTFIIGAEATKFFVITKLYRDALNLLGQKANDLYERKEDLAPQETRLLEDSLLSDSFLKQGVKIVVPFSIALNKTDRIWSETYGCRAQGNKHHGFMGLVADNSDLFDFILTPADTTLLRNIYSRTRGLVLSHQQSVASTPRTEEVDAAPPIKEAAIGNKLRDNILKRAAILDQSFAAIGISQDNVAILVKAGVSKLKMGQASGPALLFTMLTHEDLRGNFDLAPGSFPPVTEQNLELYRKLIDRAQALVLESHTHIGNAGRKEVRKMGGGEKVMKSPLSNGDLRSIAGDCRDLQPIMENAGINFDWLVANGIAKPGENISLGDASGPALLQAIYSIGALRDAHLLKGPDIPTAIEDSIIKAATDASARGEEVIVVMDNKRIYTELKEVPGISVILPGYLHNNLTVARLAHYATSIDGIDAKPYVLEIIRPLLEEMNIAIGQSRATGTGGGGGVRIKEQPEEREDPPVNMGLAEKLAEIIREAEFKKGVKRSGLEKLRDAERKLRAAGRKAGNGGSNGGRGSEE